MSITLPYPPSSNRYWRNVSGRMVKSRQAREYAIVAGWAARAAGAEVYDGPVGLELRVYRPQRRGDLDNSLKILIDSLQGILFTNDSQVVEIHAYQADDRQSPRVEVTAWPIV